ncbi:MAG TPA: MltA domain-containing protein, partial [Thermodesulfobacteriota bacterium]|nr:MltA domain-containing protein [Thermodesulfobacteriota bacterium]
VSCVTVFKRPGFEFITPKASESQEWKDDLDFTSLEKAVNQSISYYQRVSQGQVFEYGNISYSPKELEASMRLFLEIMRIPDEAERFKQLRKKFLFLESKNDKGRALFTGYYEPILEGSLQPTERFTAPLYGKPDDLVEADLGLFREEWKGERIIGRVDVGRLIPYDSREEIVYRNSLKDRARPIAYVENDIELFFLQIQGSGLVKLPDGRLKRVNYAGQNGHPYRPIGRLLLDRIPLEKMSMQALKGYLYSHPEEVKEILTYNPSYTFFREVEEGPLGNIEVPLTPERSIAMDRNLIPRGSLAFVQTSYPFFSDGRLLGWKPMRRFVLVQDTGGAIRGHGRVDIFWGNGEKAELTAGHMKQTGQVFLLVARKKFL